MPFHLIGNALENIDNSTLALSALGIGTAYAAKVYASGRKNIWERDWTGKLIMVIAPPTPTTLALLHALLQLPSPPTVLYLPPYPSPLPEFLLTILHTIRLAITSPHGALHCEPLPPTASGVRDFVRKWAGAPMGTVGEGGRRVDAIVLGGAWECAAAADTPLDPAEDPAWTPNQMHYHLITALLPSLLRAPPERDIRVIQLVSPAWSAAMPGIQAGLEGKPVPVDHGLTAAAAKRGVASLLLQTQLALILDTLASAAYSKQPVPVDPENPKVKKRDESVQSNILALSVVMPWTRDEVVRPVWGEGSLLQRIMWIILLPLILIITPSPAKSVQSIIHALSAPLKFPGEDETHKAVMEVDEAGKEKTKDEDTVADPRRNGVRQGDVVRDCAVIDIPPVLRDPALARATYERIEGEVEVGVRASEARQKAFSKDKGEDKGKDDKGKQSQ